MALLGRRRCQCGLRGLALLWLGVAWQRAAGPRPVQRRRDFAWIEMLGRVVVALAGMLALSLAQTKVEPVGDPTLFEFVSVRSNNKFNTDRAKIGDLVIMDLTLSRPVDKPPVLKLGGRTCDLKKVGVMGLGRVEMMIISWRERESSARHGHCRKACMRRTHHVTSRHVS
jgi:hypothetical protein